MNVKDEILLLSEREGSFHLLSGELGIKGGETEGRSSQVKQQPIFMLNLETHIKKNFFLVVGPLRLYPPYTNGLVVHATF